LAHQSLIVVDDFYENPDEIRRLALSQNYREKPGATYPGREAIAGEVDWSKERASLRQYIEDAVDGVGPKDPPFQQGKFRIAVSADQSTRIDGVHVDVQRWSAVVYLTLPEHCREGIILYRHRPTQSVFWQQDWLQKNFPEWFELPDQQFKSAILSYLKDSSDFEQIGLIPMAYNRAILLMAQAFHATGAVFGDNINNGRLTQHFEFYEDDEVELSICVDD
jgi:Family of unknown function (DUF6445)